MLNAQQTANYNSLNIRESSRKIYDSYLRGLNNTLEAHGYSFATPPSDLDSIMRVFDSINSPNAKYYQLLLFRKVIGMEDKNNNLLESYIMRVKASTNVEKVSRKLESTPAIKWIEVQKKAVEFLKANISKLDGKYTIKLRAECLFCLFMLELPPLRLGEYISARLDDAPNSIDLDNGVYILREYKTSSHFARRYGSVERVIPLNRQLVKGILLPIHEDYGTIRDFLLKYPVYDNYAFGRNYSINAASDMIKRLFGVDSQDLRVAYCSSYLGDWAIDEASKEAVAYVMGHSRGIQIGSYTIPKKND